MTKMVSSRFVAEVEILYKYLEGCPTEQGEDLLSIASERGTWTRELRKEVKVIIRIEFSDCSSCQPIEHITTLFSFSRSLQTKSGSSFVIDLSVDLVLRISLN